jgi:hypothetical protein
LKIKNIIIKILSLATVFILHATQAQAPQKMSYQAVLRNATNALVTNMAVGMKISVLQGTISGTVAYAETQTPSTNANGLVSIEIGTGTSITSTFASINWANGPYFIKTETDPSGGTNYTISGTSQLLSVPYALFSANAQVGGFVHYLGEPYLGGIIYELYKGSDGLEHGLVVALTESYGQWQTTGTLVNANRTWDGAYNTALMTGSPISNYITTLGAGWYIPSIDELAKLYHNHLELNKALFTGGNSLLLSSGFYWSSTESRALFSSANVINFGSNSVSPRNKTYAYKSRGVKAF